MWYSMYLSVAEISEITVIYTWKNQVCCTTIVFLTVFCFIYRVSVSRQTLLRDKLKGGGGEEDWWINLLKWEGSLKLGMICNSSMFVSSINLY